MNPSGPTLAYDRDTPDGLRTYTANLLALLGDREPLGVLRQTPAALRAAVEGLDEEALCRPEKPGKWCVKQVLGHLVDAELAYGFRLRAVLAEDEPALVPFDHDRWAERLGYDADDAGETLDAFAALRRRTVRLFERLTEVDRARIGHHAERGPESVGTMMRLLAAHDLAHLRQLERLRAAHAAQP